VPGDGDTGYVVTQAPIDSLAVRALSPDVSVLYRHVRGFGGSTAEVQRGALWQARERTENPIELLCHNPSEYVKSHRYNFILSGHVSCTVFAMKTPQAFRRLYVDIMEVFCMHIVGKR